jgi:hypothetical protein
MFCPGDESESSSSELALSAMYRSTQPSGRGSCRETSRAVSDEVIRFEGFLGRGLSELVRDGGPGREVDDDGIVGRDWYRPDLCDDDDECNPPRIQGGSSGITGN